MVHGYLPMGVKLWECYGALLEAGTEKENAPFLSHCPRRRRGERERDNGWMDGWRPSFHGRIGRRRTKERRPRVKYMDMWLTISLFFLLSSLVSRLSPLDSEYSKICFSCLQTGALCPRTKLIYIRILHTEWPRKKERWAQWTGLDNWEYVDNGTTKTNKKIVQAELEKKEREWVKECKR